MTRGQIIRHNGWQTIVSLDQALHCLGGLLAALLLACVPGVVRPVVVRHCELSWESARDGRQLPPELRQEVGHGQG